MTPTIALIAVSLIAAGLCVAVGIMQWRIGALNADATYARYKAQKKAEHLEELLTEAKAEADNEYQLRRQAERNLAEANEATRDWKSDAKTYEERLRNYSRPRDPKTGRFYSAKAKPRPTAKEMEQGLAAFDAMMGNAIEQLQGLTIR